MERSNLEEGAQGRPFLGVDSVFQSVGFRYQRVSRRGQAPWTTVVLTALPLRGGGGCLMSFHPFCPSPLPQRNGGRGHPMGGRDPHTLLCQGTQNHQHPGQTEPQGE